MATGLLDAAIAAYVITLMPEALRTKREECPSVCLHPAKWGLFIERNWIVTKSFAGNKRAKHR